MIKSTGIMAQPWLLSLLIGSSQLLRDLAGINTLLEFAYDRVYYPETPPNHARPCGIISCEGTVSSDQFAINLLRTRAALQWSIELNTPQEIAQQGNDETILGWADEQFGNILSQWQANVGRGQPDPDVEQTHLDLRNLNMVSGPYMNPPGEEEVNDPEDIHPDLPWVWAEFEAETR